MRESRLSGSVEGVVSNHDPYSDSSSAYIVSDALSKACRTYSPQSAFHMRGGVSTSPTFGSGASLLEYSLVARREGAAPRAFR
jgi:hypothetical protein